MKGNSVGNTAAQFELKLRFDKKISMLEQVYLTLEYSVEYAQSPCSLPQTSFQTFRF